MSLVYVQLDEFTGLCVRVFRNRKRAYEEIDSPKCIEKALAVSQIRRQVFDRQDGLCLKCGEIITRASMHMDEILARGDFDADGHSGEVSLSNCQGLCSACHIGPRGEHSNRKPMFTICTDREPITR